MKLSEFLIQQQAYGHYTFSLTEVEHILKRSKLATRKALFRAKQKHVIAEPLRGFFAIVPPEYRKLGCLPAEQFVAPLMKYINIPYYVGLLSAAQFYGAAHQQPQVFQVMIEQKHRAITCGIIKVVFVTRSQLSLLPTQQFKIPRGMITVSTPEVTAMDLVTYPYRCGGFNHVYTVMSELAETIDPKALAKLLKISCIETTWVQRLGYMLEKLKHTQLSNILYQHITKHPTMHCVLIPKDNKTKAVHNKKWNLLINAELETDI